MATAARARSATNFIACNVASRRYDIPRSSITKGALCRRIRTLVTGDRILYHGGDVEAFAAELRQNSDQQRSTEASAGARPAA